MGHRLYQAALTGDLVVMAASLAQGADVNRSIAKEEGRTALIGAAFGVKYVDNWFKLMMLWCLLTKYNKW